MAISRAQALKELLPGLNALFGLEYKKYENEHTETEFIVKYNVGVHSYYNPLGV